MNLPPKAESVTVTGAPDGYTPPLQYTGKVLPGGYARLLVSAPAHRLAAIHQALVAELTPPLRVMYRQLTDRGQGQRDKPVDYVGLELPPARVLETLQALAPLVYHDGRHQLWIAGRGQEQVVLEEVGVIYAYPDDPAFRDALDAQGVPEATGQTLAERDYVKVNFVASADPMEEELRRRLGMARWG